MYSQSGYPSNSMRMDAWKRLFSKGLNDSECAVLPFDIPQFLPEPERCSPGIRATKGARILLLHVYEAAGGKTSAPRENAPSGRRVVRLVRL